MFFRFIVHIKSFTWAKSVVYKTNSALNEKKYLIFRKKHSHKLRFHLSNFDRTVMKDLISFFK